MADHEEAFQTENYTGDEGVATGEGDMDDDIESMKQRMKEMEEEAAKLQQMQAEIEKDMGPGGASAEGAEDKEAVDLRSIYIGNVDYSATPEEIQAHFQTCGTINRVTILCDKWTGHPKGYAYVEFADPELVKNAVMLNDSLFKGRNIKVTAKRTNVPGMARGRGRGRGGYRGGGFRGGGFRGRGGFRSRRGYFSPY